MAKGKPGARPAPTPAGSQPGPAPENSTPDSEEQPGASADAAPSGSDSDSPAAGARGNPARAEKARIRLTHHCHLPGAEGMIGDVRDVPEHVANRLVELRGAVRV